MAIMWKTAMKKIERFEDVGEWRETGTLTQGVRQVTQRSGARPSGPLALLLGRSLSVAPVIHRVAGAFWGSKRPRDRKVLAVCGL